MDARTTGTSRQHRLAVPRNVRNVMGGIGLLRSIAAREAAVVFLDPQYRGVLDEMAYGNEGGRQVERSRLPQMTDDQIRGFVEEAERVLRPSGHMFLWVDKFTIGSGRHLRYLMRTPLLRVVDVIHWNKTRPGMGRRARCASEYLIVLQKAPQRAKDVWTDHRLSDAWTEQADRSRHPHAKPHVLTERLIRAVTKRGDMVVDPCAGSYVVLEACIASGRNFLGCDLIGGNDAP